MDEILANTKKYEDLAEKRSVFYGDVDRALEIVKKFIISRQRILYGGMAIDLSLKEAGHSGIYAADATPDYDFMSPDYFNESNELAAILAKEGFENVSAIHAIHLTSRRVRVNYIPVADITYIPQNLYDQIPTLDITSTIEGMQGSRVVHPHFQYMDMFRALNTPYEKPPGEVILQRTKKDIKRYRMLAQYYPILVASPLVATKSVKEISIETKLLQNAVLGGFFAYAILYKIWKAMNFDSENVIPLECKISADFIKIDWGENWSVQPMVNIITDYFQNLSVKSSTKTYFNKYLDDLRPRTIIIESADSDSPTLEIFDNYGRKLPVFNLMKLLNYWDLGAGAKEPKKSKETKKGGASSSNIYICQSYYVLLYFLLKSFENPKDKDFYLGFYQSTLAMIHDAEEMADAKKYSMIPFFLTPRVYGVENWSPDYINTVRDKIAMLDGKKVMSRGPFGFYPKADDVSSFQLPEFDPTQNELFLIDGTKRNKPFTPLLEYFKDI
jgi:hypothetical protein